MTTVTRRTTDRRVRRDQENVGPSRQERLLEDLKSDMHSPEKWWSLIEYKCGELKRCNREHRGGRELEKKILSMSSKAKEKCKAHADGNEAYFKICMTEAVMRGNTSYTAAKTLFDTMKQSSFASKRREFYSAYANFEANSGNFNDARVILGEGMEIVGVRDRAKLESDLKAVEDASTAYYGAASQDVNSNSSTAGQSTEAIINADSTGTTRSHSDGASISNLPFSVPTPQTIDNRGARHKSVGRTPLGDIALSASSKRLAAANAGGPSSRNGGTAASSGNQNILLPIDQTSCAASGTTPMGQVRSIRGEAGTVTPATANPPASTRRKQVGARSMFGLSRMKDPPQRTLKTARPDPKDDTTETQSSLEESTKGEKHSDRARNSVSPTIPVTGSTPESDAEDRKPNRREGCTDQTHATEEAQQSRPVEDTPAEDNRPALEKKVEGKEKKERKKERTLRRTSTVDFMMNIEKEIDEREKNVSLRAKSMFEQMEEIDPERIIRIKKVPYLLLGKLGEGGHGSVYKVMNQEWEMFAVKIIVLQKIDKQTVRNQYMEIDLLKRLKDKTNNIVQLVDFDVQLTEQKIYVLQECGEIDFQRLLRRLQGRGTNRVNYIRLYWQQMLEAVQVIHEERIVHGDLKPANFVCFKGTLKLIDFGIAKTMADNTTKIIRNTVVGSLNYMAPEILLTLDEPEHKQGRPSDVWSLGCILYKMVYGRLPFQEGKGSGGNQQALIDRITNKNHSIRFPRCDNADLMDVMKGCLIRDPLKRYTIPNLLKHKFLLS